MKIDSTYTKKLKFFSRNLRKNQTPGERILWAQLRNRQLHSIKFRRQVSIQRYIVDFYSEELNLIIEIDGSSHDEAKYNYDLHRHLYLLNQGFKILRFTEYKVRINLDDVLQTIENFINDIDTDFTSSQPSPQGEGVWNSLK